MDKDMAAADRTKYPTEWVHVNEVKRRLALRHRSARNEAGKPVRPYYGDGMDWLDLAIQGEHITQGLLVYPDDRPDQLVDHTWLLCHMADLETGHTSDAEIYLARREVDRLAPDSLDTQTLETDSPETLPAMEIPEAESSANDNDGDRPIVGRPPKKDAWEIVDGLVRGKVFEGPSACARTVHSKLKTHHDRELHMGHEFDLPSEGTVRNYVRSEAGRLGITWK
jgi:hypothetical protein